MASDVSRSALFQALDGVAYAVDPAGVIVEFGGNDLSASRGATFDPAPYLKRPLDAFIKGEAVRALYRRLVARVTGRRQAAVSFQCRCDTPGARRTMRIAITPLPLADGATGALFQSIILSEEIRPAVTLLERMDKRFAGDADAAIEDQRIVTMCSFCQRLNTRPAGDEPEWLEPEEYYRHGGRSDVLLNHGMCADCYSGLPAD